MNAAAPTASPAQIKFITDLARERDVTDEQRDFVNQVESGKITLTKAQASRLIEALQAKPKVARRAAAPAQAPAVENGRYAIDYNGVLKFFKVNTPTEGRWAGFTFVDAQGGPELYPVKDRAYKADVLALIAADATEAMLRYGRELGHCGHCGRALTDELSRYLGIGPVCRANLDLDLAHAEHHFRQMEDKLEEDRALQQQDEIAAENAWLRAAENNYDDDTPYWMAN